MAFDEDEEESKVASNKDEQQLKQKQ
jgi:hypothetical protein